MRLGFALLVAAATLLVPTLAWAAFGVPCDPGNGRSVAIFYYAWYGTPDRDGGWRHWNQKGAAPPLELGSSYYPARGAYSSDDSSVVGSPSISSPTADAPPRR